MPESPPKTFEGVPLSIFDATSEEEILMLEHNSLYRSLTIGDRNRMKASMQQLLLLRITSADEIIITTQIYGHEDRIRNYEIIAEMLR
ncbi:hypothetical protein SAMN02799624_05098 [Paenibacillus sp. UNC496MF]|nr:hypothetical protein SAMN02799624_05098 [Paenibacillus sp. UNC496MF]